MWFLSSFQMTKNISSKFVNFVFLYFTMIFAVSNFSYFGLDYTLTNPLGFVHEDRLFEQKAFLETAFLNTKASDRNTRRNRGRHGRRERWKRRVRRYRTFDASMYDQGIYDLFTVEDLNYGFDRFWLRRKMRNHRVRFRFFPGPWMRSFKKQLSRPRLESFLGPRVEFFRILFEQAYHPEFHEFSTKKNLLKTKNQSQPFAPNFAFFSSEQNQQKNENVNVLGNQNFISWNLQKKKKQRILKEHSTFRKFVRKVQNRVKRAKIEYEIQNPQNFQLSLENSKNFTKPISSKIWKNFAANEKRNFSSQNFASNFQNSSISSKSEENFLFERFSNKLFSSKNADQSFGQNTKDLKKHLSKKDLFVQRYKMFLSSTNQKGKSKQNFEPNEFLQTGETEKKLLFSGKDMGSLQDKQIASKNQKNLQGQSDRVEWIQNSSQYRPITLFHPIQFYLQKEKALKRKFQFYGVKLFRNFGVEKNAPYFRVFLKRFFYHYKPSLRWERTLRVATYRRARRKTSRVPRKLNVSKNSQILAQVQPFESSLNTFDSKNLPKDNQTMSFEDRKTLNLENRSGTTDPTHFYSLVNKRASRYRFQIYKDVLQHWYYSPLNRLLLKFDVDSFIRRQPNSYFLTKNDEKFLHLKRQLLSEYSESLRWYTFMEHYSTMKNQIGGTKSLSNRAYNQQFSGTFKKIRHLFNITPSFRESSVLKFDQPLYNEYKTSENGAVFNDSVLHEEFFSFPPNDKMSSRSEEKEIFQADMDAVQGNPDISGVQAKHEGLQKSQNFQTQSSQSLGLRPNPENLINQSITILRDYLATAAPIRQQYIENLFKEKNYWELTQFFFRGQKIRGTQPITNETDFLSQEKEALLSTESSPPLQTMEANGYALKDELWISLLKKCMKKFYDQEALKNYVSLKKEKYEIQKQRHEKYLKNRLQRIQESIVENPEIFGFSAGSETNFSKMDAHLKEKIQDFENSSGSPSSFQKALKESILWEKNSLASSSFQTVDKLFGPERFAARGKKFFLEKTNLRKNQLPMYSELDSAEKGFSHSSLRFQSSSPLQFEKINSAKLRSLFFTKNLRFAVKKQAIQLYEVEKNVQGKFPTSRLKTPAVLQSFSEKTKKLVWDFLRFKPFSPPSFGLIGEKKNFENIEGPTFEQKRKFSFLFSRNKSNFSTSGEGKDFEFWKKRENILAKRKKLRKTFKRLRNQKTSGEKIVFEKNDFFFPFSQQRNNSSENRQKIEKNENLFLKKQKMTSSRFWTKYFESESRNSEQEKSIFRFLPGIGEKKFGRKRSRLRRYSSFKGRGPIKKRTLREKLKRQFKSFKKYGRNQNMGAPEQTTPFPSEREKKKVEFIQYITQRKYEPDGKFLQREEKQRRTRQSKHRAWKKKKQNFAQKRRKLRKRRRSTVSKMRIFNKKISRILSRKEIQTWWWKTFFPHFQKTTEKLWIQQKNMQIRKEFLELSEKDIFERDQKNKNNFGQKSLLNGDLSSLQIGDKDFKPFAIPEAARIREKLVQQNILRFDDRLQNGSEKIQDKNISENLQLSTREMTGSSSKDTNSLAFESHQIFEEVNHSLFNNQRKREIFSSTNQKENSLFFVSTNPLPFYAGWDESLRKFVLTNRFLSRKECLSCSSIPWNGKALEKGGNQEALSFGSFANEQNVAQKALGFQKAPFQGMNAATTLYWQVPFTTYDPDQFFALGMDGFSPLGWRNFSLNHSKQTTKPILVKNFFSFEQNSQNFSKNLQMKIFNQSLNFFPKTTQKNEIDKNFELRRVLKKQKRLKKHPRPPVWFPSGSLSQQVLPVHYIYVFYKRSRLPRDRYIRRRLRSTFSQKALNLRGTSLEGREANGPYEKNSQVSLFQDRTKMVDFTLRKRTKPRRKYHRKRFSDLSEKNQFFVQARRRKFRTFDSQLQNENLSEMTRPSSKISQISSRTDQAQSGPRSGKQDKRILSAERAKQRRKIQDSKQQTENLRVRQLRRRVHRQVYRPVWRSRPRAGGFVWPGDYLRLEFVKASPLKATTIAPQQNEKQEVGEFTPTILSDSRQKADSRERKIRKKTRRTLQEWQIQPKRYLVEKHNLKVLKTRLEKSLNINNS
jgi:hypothetical protein